MCGAGLRVRCWGGGVGGRAKARAGRLGRVYRAQWLPALAVNSVALIWKLAQMDILAIRGQLSFGAWA